MKTLKLLTALMALFLFLSCSETFTPTMSETPPLIGNSTRAVVLQSDATVTLLAGQTIPVGTVSAVVEGNDLVVTYSTVDGWLLYETHLWAGTSLSEMPQNNKGNPKLGLFPYNSGELAGVSTYSVNVPLATFGLDQSMTSCDDVLAFLVTHAVVKKSDGSGGYQAETAFGEGTRLVQKGSWATWFSLLLGCDNDEPKEGRTETAFAFGNNYATCFIDGIDDNGDGIIDFQSNRWGWSNGELIEGTYSFEIYAGAGQCDLTKGTYVGDLTVVYSNGTATATYIMLPEYTMAETHLYIGNEPLPRKDGEYTVAPGQYGAIHELEYASEDEYVITGLTGTIYVVAHAVVVFPEE